MNRTSIAGKASTCCHCRYAIHQGDRIALVDRHWVHEECPDRGTVEREQEREWEQPGWQRKGLRREPVSLPRSPLHIERAKRPILRDTKLSPPISTPPDPRLTLPSVVAAREQARAEMAEAIRQARAERAQRPQAAPVPDPDPCALPEPAEPQEPGKGPPEPEKGGEVGRESSGLPPLSPEQQEQVEAMERWQEQSKSQLSRLVAARLAGEGPPLRWLPGAVLDPRRGARKRR